MLIHVTSADIHSLQFAAYMMIFALSAASTMCNTVGINDMGNLKKLASINLVGPTYNILLDKLKLRIIWKNP